MKLERFTADGTLLYAIQQYTKEPSADILAYFQRLTLELVESLKKSQAQFPTRKLVAMYPSTSIPFSVEVQCDRNFKSLFVHICFPKKTTYLEGIDKIANEVAEAVLLGGPIPFVEPFRAPYLKAPRGKKH